MIKRILVAGASGQVGLELISLLKKNYKILATYNKSKKNLIKHKNIKWIKINFSKKYKVKYKFSYIINCIATHEFTKKKTIKKYIESNILCIKNLVKLGILKKIILFINLSTINIYGKINKKILDEEYKKKEQDILGLTKLIGENIIKDSSLNYINLRLPGIISKKNSNRPWLNKITLKIKNSELINIFNINKKINGILDILELYKLIKYLIIKNKIIKNDYNIAASKPLKIYTIIKFLINKFSSSSKIVIKNSKKKTFLISTKKIKKDLKFNFSTTYQIIKRNFN